MAYGSPGSCVSSLAIASYRNQLAFIHIRKLLIFNGLHLFSSFLKIFLVLLAVHWQRLVSCTTQRPNPKTHETMKTDYILITNAATLFDAQGYAVQHGVEITDHGDTLGINRGEHLKSDLVIDGNSVTSTIAGWILTW